MANETQRLWDLLTNRLTPTRAGYLDELDFDLDARLGSPAGASLAVDLAAIKALVDSGETDSSYSYTDAGGEQDVYEDAVTTRRKISFTMDINAMTNGGVVKIYIKVDGTNYRVWTKDDVDSTTSGGTEDAYTFELTTNQNVKVTYEEDADEGAARSIPYSVVTEVKE